MNATNRTKETASENQSALANRRGIGCRPAESSGTEPAAADRIYLTTTIPYVNAPPHVGHALELVQADALARWHRARGTPVRLQTGTDENAFKNVLSARERGVPIREFIDENAGRFRSLVDALDISADVFVRTATPEHERAVHAFLGLVQPDDLYRRAYRGLYCRGCEDFFLEKDLDDDGRCPDHGASITEVEEENVFFRLSRYQVELAALIRSDRLRITPEARRNEVLSFIERGLQDISISRDAARSGGWGIPFPELAGVGDGGLTRQPARATLGDGDPVQSGGRATPGGDSPASAQVVYVWIDALVNYLTGLGFPGDGATHRSGRTEVPSSVGSNEPIAWQHWWNEGAQRIHLIGKNVWKFHAVYWPALLLSAGLPLPYEILVHGFLTENGRKISKSSGTAVDPTVYVDRFGADPLRYFFLRYVRPFEDSDFSEERLAAAYRSDLANGLGNLVSRLTALCERFGVGAERSSTTGGSRCADALADYRFDRALEELWKEVDALNAEIAEARPWDAGDSAESLGAVRARLAGWIERLAAFADGLEPFLPETSARIHAAISGGVIRKCEPLFPRKE
jgi:methionyl-tRNA synthetase